MWTLTSALLLSTSVAHADPDELTLRDSSYTPECRAAVHDHVKVLMDEKATALVYHWLFSASLESVSWVRFIERPASYVLFSGPEMTLGLIMDAPKGPHVAMMSLASDVVMDAAFLAAEMYLEHPKSRTKNSLPLGTTKVWKRIVTIKPCMKNMPNVLPL